jgi:hypothetical protein
MNIRDIPKDLLKSVSSVIEKKTVKEVDEPTAKGEKDFKDLHLKDLEVKGSGEEVVESKQKVLKAMIKGGSNPKEAESLIKKYFSYVAKKYSDVTPAKKAEIIVTLAANESTDLEEATDPDKELASWLRKRLDKNRPGDRDLRKELEKLLKKLEEGADSDVKGDKEEYQKFFQGMLKKFGVKSPAELSGDKEKEFYDAIDAGWEADDEKKEENLQEEEFGYETIEEAKSATGYEIYHKTFSGAMQHAYAFAKKKFGLEIDPDEISVRVGMGPKKPSTNKTNSYSLKSVGGKKGIEVQVYNTGKSYELNMYKQ